MARNKQFGLLLAASLVVLAYGLVELFELRFAAGDVYPAYSSLRTDPLGTKAFLAGLERLPGMAVRRHFQPWAKLREDPPSTVLLLGFPKAELTRLELNQARDLETVARGGGRVVIALFPTLQSTATNPAPSRAGAQGDSAAKPHRPGARKPADAESDEESLTAMASLAGRWGFGLAYQELPRKPDGSVGEAEARPADPWFARTAVSWHSSLVFENPAAAWHKVYLRGRQPVILERRFGAGTIVLCGDSFLFSNEAMRRERHPELLAWMIGPHRRVIFDETHLGIAERAGVMTLARRYRLHGLLAGVVLLAGLFVWKNATSFIPPAGQEAASAENLAEGKEAAAGLLNLLRRNLSAQDLPALCLGEWEKSFARHRPELIQKAAQARVLLEAESARPPRERNPVAVYRALSRVLNPRP